ncbi:hypothetical protein LMG28138_05946 [Pararobbsia alpina]|uniref:Uncharacterized protein n=2 Tax=Pararobbsia alpina TaxID=621374 RepID=A0A6S7BPE4_9BURK|nr:hypothetical protein LMG28138_05946 [Pararobbsia alpina]
MDSPGFWTTPTIHDYGKSHFLPNGAFKPQPGHTYKIVFALTQGPKTPGEVNPALDVVARAVNLYVASGVPLHWDSALTNPSGRGGPNAEAAARHKEAT